MRKSVIFWMPLEIDFWWNFGGFCEENGSKMAPKSEPKSILALKRKNQLNASRLVPNWVRRVQVGSKNQSKIDQNLKSKLECLLASIFHRFWWVLGGKLGRKIEPRSIKNGIEKTMKKRRAPRWQISRNKKPQLPAAEGVWGPGEWRGKPLPRGLKPEGLKRRGVEYRYTTLNHPSPEGWWDL